MPFYGIKVFPLRPLRLCGGLNYYVILESFKRFLSSKGKVNDKYLPFYLKWSTEDFRFLKHLSKSHEDWQVNQADHALSLYGYFLSR